MSRCNLTKIRCHILNRFNAELILWVWRIECQADISNVVFQQLARYLIYILKARIDWSINTDTGMKWNGILPVILKPDLSTVLTLSTGVHCSTDLKG
jgi:hypothetical protein